MADWWTGPVQAWLDGARLATSTRTQADAAWLWMKRAGIDARRVDEVGPGDADALLGALRKARRRSRTCQIYLMWLKRALQLAVDAGHLVAIPKLRAVRITDARPHRWLDADQMGTLLAELERRAAAGEVPWGTVVAVRLQESCFMRPGEVLARRWEDLRTDRRRWVTASLEVGPRELGDATWRPKRASAARTVSVPPRALAALRDLWLRQGQPAAGWIFPGEDAGEHQGSVRKALRTTCRQLKLPELWPHALRHSGATRLAQGGVERRTVMAIGGWASPEMLDSVYAHTTDARAAQVLAQHEVGAVQPGATVGQPAPVEQADQPPQVSEVRDAE